MTDKKKPDADGEPDTNYLGQPANQESTVREAKDNEKPDPTSVANVEEVKARDDA